MELFKIREEYTEKIREYDRYILSRKKLGINDNLLTAYLIENELIKNLCKNCKSQPLWLEKPITLILDRIDNNLSNNTLENLRLLCPNCYCQIRKKTTLLEKVTKKAMSRCIDCNKLLKNRSTSCAIESDTDTKRGKKTYSQSFRCKSCLEKKIAEPDPEPQILVTTQVKLI